FQKSFDRDAGLRPLAGIVDEITEHFLEILLLATEASVLGRVDVDGNTAIAVDLFHRAGERRCYGTDLGHSTNGRNARSEPGTLEMPRDLIAHDCCLLAHFRGKRITALARSLVHHERGWRFPRVRDVGNAGGRGCGELPNR